MWVVGLIFGFWVVYHAVQWWIRKRVVEEVPRGSFATLPGGLKPVRSLLELTSPGLYYLFGGWAEQKENYRVRIFIARQFWFGASNPAVVVHENPTIIAAYAADCDAVLLVRFWPLMVEDAKKRGVGLHIGARLLTVNTYFESGQEWKGDKIELGSHQSHMWSSFRPYIAEFLCKDFERIMANKAQIPENLWQRAKELGEKKLRGANLDEVRWGNPTEVEIPKSYLLAIESAKDLNIEY